MAKCTQCGKQMNNQVDTTIHIYCFECLMKMLTPEQKEFVRQMTVSFVRLLSPAVFNTIGTETGRVSSRKRVAAGARQLCAIPFTDGDCDLDWGHDGNQHQNSGDGFFAPQYREEHARRQEERKKKEKKGGE